ncbi:uncharacterized protein [Rutidosis leptorrhynchoides]|uniref:uncharacterized protein n=1 Tax=Rutidosis leptorrhynchoides TaxID=125765 RepID=UPI003A98D18E
MPNWKFLDISPDVLMAEDCSHIVPMRGVSFIDDDDDDDDCHLAFQLCECNLHDYVRNVFKDVHHNVILETRYTLRWQNLIQGMLQAVHHIHSNKKAHADLNPCKILISNNCVKIGGMTRCKELDPESRDSDYFDLARNELHIFTNGRHVFTNERNSLGGLDVDELFRNLQSLRNYLPEIHDAISKLLYPSERILVGIDDVNIKLLPWLMGHPSLWSPEKRINFFIEVSNSLFEDRGSWQYANDVENCYNCGDWSKVFHPSVIKALERIKVDGNTILYEYDKFSLTSLLRFIRNIFGHTIKTFFRAKFNGARTGYRISRHDLNFESVERILRYFYPGLLISLYYAIHRNLYRIPTVSRLHGCIDGFVFDFSILLFGG